MADARQIAFGAGLPESGNKPFTNNEAQSHKVRLTTTIEISLEK